MGSGLRGTGIVKPTMMIQALSVLLNIVLAPILIAGWGTGYAMGVAGAGFASSIAIVVGIVLLGWYFLRVEKYVAFDAQLWRPRLAVWKRMLVVGLPAGAEFGLMFCYMVVIYWVISGFGATAQAGFVIGSRIMQSIFLPAMAIAFAAGPIAGQNFGANKPARVRDTFFKAAALSTVVMIGVTVFLQWRPEVLVAFFPSEPAEQEVGATFLRIISWTFIAQGIVFTCSGMFQGLGNTIPAMLSSGIRLAVFVPLAVWVSSQPKFHLDQVWWLSVATVWLQAVVSSLLLGHQFKHRLVDRPAAASVPPVAAAPAET